MATYNTHIDEQTGVTVFEIVGKFEIEELISYVESDHFDTRTLLLVMDMRQADLRSTSRGKIAKLVRSADSAHKPGTRAAFVLKKGPDFKKGRDILAQLETLRFVGSFRLFSDIQRAKDWVRR